MGLDDGLVRLFDNLSVVEMAQIGVQKGVADVYAVEANEVVESQITQDIDVGGVSRLDDMVVCTVCVDMGDEPDDRVHSDFEGCESGKGGESEGGESESGEIGVGDRVHSDFEDFEGCESGKGSESDGGEIGVGDSQVGKVKGKETEKAKAYGKGKGKEKEKATGKGNVIDGVRTIVGEDTRKENWSRAFFGFDAKYDILVNNISECYNKVLLFAQEKPLYAMLECIRMYLMDRFTTRRKMGERMEDAFGPKIRKKLENAKGKIGVCVVREAGEWIY